MPWNTADTDRHGVAALVVGKDLVTLELSKDFSQRTWRTLSLRVAKSLMVCVYYYSTYGHPFHEP
jgi:hypothetical protein